MKYIFDFDDVLFDNTKKFKEHMFKTLENAGVPRESAMSNYTPKREQFSLKDFIKSMFALFDIKKDAGAAYEEIMGKCPQFVNNEVLEAIKKWGPQNCYIVTSGDEHFQLEKINKSGIGALFLASNIYTTPRNKTNAVREICAKSGNELEVFVFFDDKPEYIREINEGNFPNVTSILYKPGEFERFMKGFGPTSELKKRK